MKLKKFLSARNVDEDKLFAAGTKFALIQLAEEDPSLIHQVIAPPGSALFFGETL